MDANNTVCPVCTLYLRPGITLKNHLSSHPKQKVIEALVRLAENDEKSAESEEIVGTSEAPATSAQINTIVNHTWNQGNLVNMPPIQGNHVFIYQQSMSSTTTPQQGVLNVNPLTQQYVIPAMINPQMMPYVYQQQQVIMSSGSCLSPLRTPFELPPPPPPSIETTTSLTESEEPLKTDELHTTLDLKEPESPLDGASQDDQNNEIIQDTIIESVASPHSPAGSDWSLRVRSDLSKACQTQTNINTNSQHSLLHDPDDLLDESQQSCLGISNSQFEENSKNTITTTTATNTTATNFYFVENPESDQVNYNTVQEQSTHHQNSNNLDLSQNYEQPNPIYTASSILQSSDNLDFVDMDGMQMVMGEFAANQIISQVENFEGSTPDRPGVLMTIGGMVDHGREGSVSRESSNVNIRADERMPPRGELSGQESIGGASDITWGRANYNEGSSEISTSYDLLVREDWGASDGSDNEEPPSINESAQQPQNYDDDNDTPTIVSFSGPPLNFKCSTCGDAFICLRDRKEHEAKKHPEKGKINRIGSELGRKKIKKLVIKLKTAKPETTTENNFDNVFTNKLKIEGETENGGLPTDDSVRNESAVPAVEPRVVCPLCGCVLSNMKTLRQHQLSIHKITAQTRNKCFTCNEVFRNDRLFTEHLRVHPLECRLCGKLFYKMQNFQFHTRRHMGIKPYKCEVCEKAFLTKQKLREHNNIHTGETPIKCNLCDETFRRHSNLVQHRNRHHLNVKKKVKDYICFCKEIFHSKKKLAWHQEIHDLKPKSCTQCNEKFIHMSSLTRHMRRAHNDRFLPKGHKSGENVECPICQGVYLKSSIEVHIRNHSGQRPFACLICNKDFTTKWNLKLHKWTHASRVSKPFKCDQCKGAFIREADYTAHMNSHKSIRPYTCNYCGAQFIRKYNCQRHVKEHENEKTFNCKVCGKSFHRSYYLKDHMRIHSGIRPYSCHICGKTSTTKSNHNKHVQIHHAREPVSTEN